MTRQVTSMPSCQQRERQIKALIQAVMQDAAPDLAGHRVILFGSRARGDHRPRSDFDLGVDGNEPLPSKVFFNIEAMLDDLPTLYQIDWVDLRRVSTDFRSRALSNCEVLYG